MINIIMTRLVKSRQFVKSEIPQRSACREQNKFQNNNLPHFQHFFINHKKDKSNLSFKKRDLSTDPLPLPPL